METVLIVLIATFYATGLWFFMNYMDHKRAFNRLVDETRDAFTENNMKMAGLRDHIASIRVEVEATNKEVIEATKNIDADELDRLKDRLGLCEMASGVHRMEKSPRAK